MKLGSCADHWPDWFGAGIQFDRIELISCRPVANSPTSSRLHHRISPTVSSSFRESRNDGQWIARSVIRPNKAIINVPPLSVTNNLGIIRLYHSSNHSWHQPNSGTSVSVAECTIVCRTAANNCVHSNHDCHKLVMNLKFKSSWNSSPATIIRNASSLLSVVFCHPKREKERGCQKKNVTCM